MTDPPRDLAVSLRDAALSMIWQDSAREVEHTMDALVRAAVGAVPGVLAGALSGVEGGIVSSRHATDDVVRRLDDLQTRTTEGPGPTAVATPPADGIVRVNDLRSTEIQQRWPEFGPRAADLGCRSVLWVGLSAEVGRRSVGLTLWADRAGAFDSSATLTACLFASQAGVLLYGHRSDAGMNLALSTRDVIGQAQGVLMERFGLGPDSAFEQLVKASADAGVDVAGAARRLVEGSERREFQNRSVQGPAEGTDSSAAGVDGAGVDGAGVDPVPAERGAEPA